MFDDHVIMLSPPKDDPEVVELIARRIAIGAPGADVGDAAARAIERGDFQRIIAVTYDNYRELDRKALVRLAIALDALGRRGDAYDVLAKRDDLDSDALGVMAGRLSADGCFPAGAKATPKPRSRTTPNVTSLRCQSQQPDVSLDRV